MKFLICRNSLSCAFPYIFYKYHVIKYSIFSQKKTNNHIIFKFSKYIKLVDTSFETVMFSGVGIYSCKYSKHVYTQHKLFVLVLLKEYISTDYRDFVGLIDPMSNIKEKLDLNEPSIFTTPQKFVFKIPSSLLTFFCQKF